MDDANFPYAKAHHYITGLTLAILVTSGHAVADFIVELLGCIAAAAYTTFTALTQWEV